jgi:hypothetical protein
MDVVYSGSYFTIVAASGNNAAVGLPGVRESSGRRPLRRCAISASKELMLAEDIELQLENCPWVVRGWTYDSWVL